MTGFARTEMVLANGTAVWEVKSVNGKSLDMRFRLPSGFEHLEPVLKETVKRTFRRGNFQVSLQLNSDSSTATPSVNMDVVDQLMECSALLKDCITGPAPTIAELLALPGVLEFTTSELSETEKALIEKTLCEGFENCATAISETRCREGHAIAHLLDDQLEMVSAAINLIEKNSDRSAHAIQERLKSQVQKLMESEAGLDEQRLHQEAVVLAAKADIQEELDRLKVHKATAREMLNAGGPVGRKLDFLAQEFNRECNTICSKSNSADVTAIALDMKLVIDQFREQVQNLE